MSLLAPIRPLLHNSSTGHDLQLQGLPASVYLEYEAWGILVLIRSVCRLRTLSLSSILPCFASGFIALASSVLGCHLVVASLVRLAHLVGTALCVTEGDIVLTRTDICALEYQGNSF